MKVKNLKIIGLILIGLLVACSQGRDKVVLDGGNDMDLVICAKSADCTNRGEACFGGICKLIKSCTKTADCSQDQMCYQGQCRPNGVQACSADDSQCKGSKGTFISTPGTNYCRPFCNTDNRDITDENQKVYCPIGFNCAASRCRPVYDDIPKPCSGCFADADCPGGDICNVNNHRCIATPSTGPDGRFQAWAENFVYVDDQKNRKVGLNVINAQMGFSAHRDNTFDFYGLEPGACEVGHVLAVTNPDIDAVLPLAPFRDAGNPLMFTVSTKNPSETKEVFYDRNRLGYYSWRGQTFTTDDWISGPVSWKIPGGKDVGAHQVDGLIPQDFTTTPSLIDPKKESIELKLTDEVGITFDSPAEPGVRTILVAQYQFVSTDFITVACRALDDQQKVVLPKSVLDENNKFHVGGAISLTAVRAYVKDVNRNDVKQGRYIWAWQKSGKVSFVE